MFGIPNRYGHGALLEGARRWRKTAVKELQSIIGDTIIQVVLRGQKRKWFLFLGSLGKAL